MKQIITPEDYHKDTSRISKSGLDEIHESPFQYWWKRLSGEYIEPIRSSAFIEGDIYHNYVLEHSEFKSRFAVIPTNAPNYPTKAQWRAKEPSANSKAAMVWWTEFNKANSSKKIIKSEDLENTKRMFDVLWKNREARYYIEAVGKFEQLNEFIEPNTGAKCKNKFDKVIQSQDIIVDLKSTRNARSDKFGKDAVKHRYDAQGSFYSDGYFYGMGNGRMASFLFIAQEKEPPYQVGLYWLTEPAYNRGRRIYLEDCATYVNCLSSGVWPGYNNDKSAPLELPGWAK